MGEKREIDWFMVNTARSRLIREICLPPWAMLVPRRGAAKGHVWGHGHTEARVCVDVHGFCCHEGSCLFQWSGPPLRLCLDPWAHCHGDHADLHGPHLHVGPWTQPDPGYCQGPCLGSSSYCS